MLGTIVGLGAITGGILINDKACVELEATEFIDLIGRVICAAEQYPDHN